MGVGGKRFRGVGTRRGRDPDGSRSANPSANEHSHMIPNAVSHSTKRSTSENDLSLVDQLLVERDPEFAAEHRAAKRMRASKIVRSGHAETERHVDSDRDSDTIPSGALDPRTSAKILSQARRQREEMEEEDTNSSVARVMEDKRISQFGSLDAAEDNSSDESDQSDGDSLVGDTRFESRGNEGSYQMDAAGSQLTSADELALAMFAGREDDGVGGMHNIHEFGNAVPGRIMLADIILEKIREKAAEASAAADTAADPETVARKAKIAEVYRLVGSILAKYKSGRVPKAFKVIPKVRNWEELLYLTRPDEWTPAAYFAATRLLASNLDSKQVLVYYRDILLPRVLQDIAEHKKLNYHLFQALKKAVYKPDAFMKGILFPLCQGGGCSLREATVIGHLISQVSIPMLHSAAALLFIAEQPYVLSNSVFLHVLLDKKYALPYRVIDAIVGHFCRMKTVQESLPVVWHISLLTFARRYKTELEAWQKDDLKLLMRVQTHSKVTPEIRRELFSARCRGEVMDPDPDSIARALAST